MTECQENGEGKEKNSSIVSIFKSNQATFPTFYCTHTHTHGARAGKGAFASECNSIVSCGFYRRISWAKYRGQSSGEEKGNLDRIRYGVRPSKEESEAYSGLPREESGRRIGRRIGDDAAGGNPFARR